MYMSSLARSPVTVGSSSDAREEIDGEFACNR
jgi:hypothetical protein